VNELSADDGMEDCSESPRTVGSWCQWTPLSPATARDLQLPQSTVRLNLPRPVLMEYKEYLFDVETVGNEIAIKLSLCA
jgi:hypothetical protein